MKTLVKFPLVVRLQRNDVLGSMHYIGIYAFAHATPAQFGICCFCCWKTRKKIRIFCWYHWYSFIIHHLPYAWNFDEATNRCRLAAAAAAATVAVAVEMVAAATTAAIATIEPMHKTTKHYFVPSQLLLRCLSNMLLCPFFFFRFLFIDVFLDIVFFFSFPYSSFCPLFMPLSFWFCDDLSWVHVVGVVIVTIVHTLCRLTSKTTALYSHRRINCLLRKCTTL